MITIKMKNTICILIITTIFLLLAFSLQTTSAAKDIEIDNWNETDVTALFNGNNVNSITLEDGDSVKFNTSVKDTYTDLTLTVKHKVSIYGNGVTFSRPTKTGTAITLTNSDIFITGITFVNYSNGIVKSSTTPHSNITIDKCEFENVGGRAIRLNYVSDSSVINNKMANTGSGYGVLIENSISVNVINNTIDKGLHLGIVFDNTIDSNIGLNNVTFDISSIAGSETNAYGIYIQKGSHNVNVFGNNVTNFYEGICTSASNYVSVYENIVDRCGWGMKFSNGASHGRAYNNTVKNCYNIASKNTGTGMCIIGTAHNITAEDNLVHNNSRIGIEAKNCSDVYIYNNTVCNHTTRQGLAYFQGINIEATALNVEIIGNKVHNNYYGIALGANNDYIISNNDIYSNTQHGLTSAGASRNLTISNNNIYSNGYDGIYLTSTSNRNINLTNNTIYENRNGIDIRGNNITFDSNKIYENIQNGINIGTSSSRSAENTIINNEIYNNRYNGINGFINYNNLNNNTIYGNLREGINITGSYNNITNGSIYNNNFNGINIIGNWTIINHTEIYSNGRNGVLFDSRGSNNLLTYSNITFNALSGLLMSGVNDTVSSSSILNNTINGINVTGRGNNITYNRIYQNGLGMYNTGNNTTANFDWWGVNDITNQFVDLGVNLNLNTWYVLCLSADELDTLVNASKNCSIGEIVNLTYRLETNNYSINDPSLLPYFKVTILTSLGDNITGDIRTSGLSILVSANDPSNLDSNLEDYTLHYIRAICDDEDVILELLMEKEYVMKPTNITINVPNKVTEGDDIVITGVLTDEDDNPIANVDVTVTVDGNSYTVRTDSNGQWTYVYKAEKSGNVNVSVSYDGNEIYLPCINSTTFNIGVKPEINEDDDPIPDDTDDDNIDKDEDDTNITNKTNNNPLAVASMKNTGIPIIALVLVLIGSLGLFSRRK